jgi:hypothetical protein
VRIDLESYERSLQTCVCCRPTVLFSLKPTLTPKSSAVGTNQQLIDAGCRHLQPKWPKKKHAEKGHAVAKRPGDPGFPRSGPTPLPRRAELSQPRHRNRTRSAASRLRPRRAPTQRSPRSASPAFFHCSQIDRQPTPPPSLLFRAPHFTSTPTPTELSPLLSKTTHLTSPTRRRARPIRL